MQRYKKTMALALAGSVVAVAATGCLSQPTTPTASAGAGSGATATPPPATGLITVAGILVRKGPAEIGGWWAVEPAAGGPSWQLEFDAAKGPSALTLERSQNARVRVQGTKQGELLGVPTLRVSDFAVLP